ncbi:hypothetical protein PQ455_14600 [Sphingomonas naphthae]|uniref:Uncharacterized protein n=1 Tax=Sphingomonas naphthae TaxID=1813468 RepID=A0ABY7TIV1_9SPHN|nr:hypothetical protein [Sphingomonas naphthae]WCT72855.1 hypothetical protein PQ455_14600 [Sphingomonas naphthae]
MIHQNFPDLTPAEWRAVSIALKDAGNVGCPGGSGKGIVAKFVRAVTGNEAPPPLADPRLEAVRSFVCATRRSRRPAERMVPTLAALGFNDRQIEALSLLAA